MKSNQLLAGFLIVTVIVILLIQNFSFIKRYIIATTIDVIHDSKMEEYEASHLYWQELERKSCTKAEYWTQDDEKELIRLRKEARISP